MDGEDSRKVVGGNQKVVEGNQKLVEGNQKVVVDSMWLLVDIREHLVWPGTGMKAAGEVVRPGHQGGVTTGCRRSGA